MASAWRQIEAGMILQKSDGPSLGDEVFDYYDRIFRCKACESAFDYRAGPNLILDTGDGSKLVLTLKPPF